MSKKNGHSGIKKRMIEEIREAAETDILDYQQLVHILKKYKKPRDKIAQLVNSGMLIRLKKGLYLFSKLYRKTPLCLPWIANRLYGPSYVSLQFALAHYNLIPEKVVEVTSVTTGRKKYFETEVGRFSYVHQKEDAFSIGVALETTPQESFFIASPTKALADLISRTPHLKTVESLAEFLHDDLRIDLPENFLCEQEVIKSSSHSAVKLLPQALEML